GPERQPLEQLLGQQRQPPLPSTPLRSLDRHGAQRQPGCASGWRSFPFLRLYGSHPVHLHLHTKKKIENRIKETRESFHNIINDIRKLQTNLEDITVDIERTRINTEEIKRLDK
ncbi:MAG: hypothetical protein OXC47_07585, partial [Cyanobacteria bacterium MAG APA_bin_95]|nr:hypothetical protein [Cyanobacteria bacterium MAG APA_bin_95]